MFLEDAVDFAPIVDPARFPIGHLLEDPRTEKTVPRFVADLEVDSAEGVAPRFCASLRMALVRPGLAGGRVLGGIKGGGDVFDESQPFVWRHVHFNLEPRQHAGLFHHPQRLRQRVADVDSADRSCGIGELLHGVGMRGCLDEGVGAQRHHAGLLQVGVFAGHVVEKRRSAVVDAEVVEPEYAGALEDERSLADAAFAFVQFVDGERASEFLP